MLPMKKGSKKRRYNNCQYIFIQHKMTQIKQTLTEIKREIDSNTVITGRFDMPFISTDKSFRLKMNKEN